MKSLQQRLEQGLNPVYLVMGDALPIVSEAVAAIEAVGLAQAGIPAFNHDTVRCTEPNPERALIAARTPPMMGSLRVVVVRELGLASDAFLEGLVDYLKQPSPSTLVILTGERLPKQEKGRPAWASKIRAAMKRSGGEVLSYKQEDLRPEDDCRRYAQRLGKTLTHAAAQAELVKAVSIIQRVAGKGIIHRNQAARRVSRLNAAVKALA